MLQNVAKYGKMWHSVAKCGKSGQMWQIVVKYKKNNSFPQNY
jgi:hypothetical protein